MGLEQEIADYKKRLHKLLGQIKILEKTLLGQKKQSEEEKQKKLEQTEQNLENQKGKTGTFVTFGYGIRNTCRKTESIL